MRRVLIVDDVADLRALVRLTLEQSGAFTVVAEAADGREAVEAATVEQPDVVLLDVSMPVMDGLEALPLIRQASPRSQVVVLSGFAEHRLGEQARGGGAHGYMEKGLPPKVLVSRLLELLDGPKP